ncbi:glutathione peroxidase [Seohaeicola saemankumensis]|jgi:glutathione peroxidase|uniref:glutathione peroxidase n=1 Tax=Seohaeicola TaxID=481178 RepID=UPI0007F3938F|nr:glutathione peroxidase [Rhodobacteraceae bacterium EhC02]
MTLLQKTYPAILLTMLLAVASVILTYPANARGTFMFDSIDGGVLSLDDWRGQPVLVVNTASRCGYTGQYDELQALYDRYRDRGLVVLAVPSNDFRQELATDAEVAEFCEVNFGLDFPMTTITSVKGASAHPFYQWLSRTEGFVPGWNFNKVLIAPDGSVAGTFGSPVKPLSGRITSQIEAMLAKG